MTNLIKVVYVFIFLIACDLFFGWHGVCMSVTLFQSFKFRHSMNSTFKHNKSRQFFFLNSTRLLTNFKAIVTFDYDSEGRKKEERSESITVEFFNGIYVNEKKSK